MARTIKQNEKELYQCEECGFHYEDKKQAEKCGFWRKEHKSLGGEHQLAAAGRLPLVKNF